MRLSVSASSSKISSLLEDFGTGDIRLSGMQMADIEQRVTQFGGGFDLEIYQTELAVISHAGSSKKPLFLA